jgi:hypothetical protein
MLAAPIEHEATALDGDASARMAAQVRASALQATAASLDQLAASLGEPIVLMSLRPWPPGFPDDIAVQRRLPYESRADSVMYCQVLAERAHVCGWAVHLFDPKAVEAQAARILGARAGDVLHRPRATLTWAPAGDVAPISKAPAAVSAAVAALGLTRGLPSHGGPAGVN